MASLSRRLLNGGGAATPELAAAWFDVAPKSPNANLDYGTQILMMYDNPRPGSNFATVARRTFDIVAERLRDMDDAGVDMQILSVTVPGVQIFDADRALALAAATAVFLSRAPRKRAVPALASVSSRVLPTFTATCCASRT
jgi:5-carboxyvanillate decarboxylase